MNYGDGSNTNMRAVDHHIVLLETAAWCKEAHEGRATGVCAVPSDKLSYSQSRAVQKGKVCSILPNNSRP